MRDLSIADIEFIVTKNPVFVQSLRASSEALFSLLYCFTDPSVDPESKEHIAYSLATNADYRKVLFPELKRLLPQRNMEDVQAIFDSMSDGHFAYILPKDSLLVEDKRYDEKILHYANGKELVQSIATLLDPIMPSPSSSHSYLFGGGGIASKFPPHIESIETGIKISFVLVKSKSVPMLGLLLEVTHSEQESIYPIIINDMKSIYHIFDYLVDKKMTFGEALINGGCVK